MGPWDRLVIALVPITLILSVAGVIILRPLSRQLADLLDLLIEHRDARQDMAAQEVMQRLDAIEGRVARIESTRAVVEEGGPKGTPAVGPGESD